MGTVLVTDGETRASLAVCRSLHARGMRVVVVVRKTPCLATRSRSVSHWVLAPSPAHEPEEFVRFLADLALQEQPSLIVPVSDQALIAVDFHRDSFSGFKLAMASHDAIRAVVDKRRNLDLATRLGLPVPREVRLESRSQVDDMVRELGWPIILKRPGDPADPLIPSFRFRVLRAHDRPELDSMLDEYCSDGPYPLFQEQASGIAINVVCFAVRGRVVAAHQYQSVRTWSGSGVLRRVIPAEKDLGEYTREILEALRWDGVAHVGFFVDRSAGRVWYMEVNGRFWASVQGSVDAGWDFPGWTLDYFLFDRPPQPPPLRTGSTTCWHFGDLIALIEYLRGGACPSPGPATSRTRALFAWLAAFRPGIHSETLHWSDPGPGIGEYIDYAGEVLHALRRRLRQHQPGT